MSNIIMKMTFSCVFILSLLLSLSVAQRMDKPSISFSEIADSTIDAAAAEIEAIIEKDPDMGPKFIRMVFHDCVGGCDGCIDLENDSNAGLDIPINALRPVVNRHEAEGVVSRADLWSLSGFVAATVLQPPEERIPFEMSGYGRINCEDATPTHCHGVPCTMTRGPHRELPGIHTNTTGIYEYFEREFDFNVQQTVAIMGAHTLGKLARDHSCIEGKDGWVAGQLIGGRGGGGPTTLDNEYYKEIVGGRAGASLEDMVQRVPPWRNFVERNRDNDCRPKHVWAAFPRQTKIIMLNADVALFRNLSDANMRPNGRVRCRFRGNRACPAFEEGMREGSFYKHNNKAWVRDFKEVLTIMLTRGYRPTPICEESGLCKLLPVAPSQ